VTIVAKNQPIFSIEKKKITLRLHFWTKCVQRIVEATKKFED